MYSSFLKFFVVAVLLLIVNGCIESGPTMPVKHKRGTKFAGSRQSYYGIERNTPASDWGNIQYNISDKFPAVTNENDTIAAAIPVAIWIIGGIYDNGICLLDFPSPSPTKKYDHITFASQDEGDRHEKYLTHFDSIGVKVFLQVEAGFANMDTLINLVLGRYGKHKSVIGFGVDIEWYPSSGDKPNATVAISAAATLHLDSLVKSHKSTYRMFLKHWNAAMLPPNISDVIYIDDAQGYANLDKILQEFRGWAYSFANNDVGFQYGYIGDDSLDYKWWKDLDDPVKDIGNAIDNVISPTQIAHSFWVDFTLKVPMIKNDLFKANSKAE